MTKKLEMLEEKTIYLNSNSWKRVNAHSRETKALKREISDQSMRIIVDRDATSSDLNLNMLRDLYYNYK